MLFKKHYTNKKVSDLRSSQEETDTRTVTHLLHALSQISNYSIVMRSLYDDVVFLVF